MLAAKITPFRSLIQAAILHESRCFLGRSRSKIEAHQRLGVHGPAPSHKFIRTELICVDRVPSLIKHARTALPAADATEPHVSGNKIASRIANDGNSHLADFFHDVFTETVCIRKL